MGWCSGATIVALLLVIYSRHYLAYAACQEGLENLENIPDPEDCNAVCEVSGDPHINSFDCVRFEYHGQCDYTLVKKCAGDIPEFEIIGEFYRLPLKNVRSVVKKLRIVAEGTIVEMDHVFGVTINGQAMSISKETIPFGTVQRYCNAVVLSMNNGITIHWSGPFRALIEIAHESRDAFSGNVCGLCGNFNGAKFDDFTTKDKDMVYDVVKFGDSWRTEGDCQLCDDCKNKVCHSNPTHKERAYDICQIFKNGAGNMQFCGENTVDSFFEQCVTILCASIPEHGGICQLIIDHINECAANGIIVDVNLEAFCEIEEKECVLADATVPVGETVMLDDCSKICTCENHATMSCQAADGCGDTEVCEIRNGVRGCYCRQGNFISEEGTCREMFRCRACGDPHYLTFDGTRYDYMGSCQYILAQSQGDAPNDFLVVGDNLRPHPNSRVTITRFVHVFVYGLEVKFSWDTPDVIVNGDVVDLPYRLSTLVHIFRSGTNTVLITDYGLQVFWNGRHCVDISIPDTFLYQVDGLCGHLSKDPADDFTRPDGEIEPDKDKFGDGWGIGDCEPCTPETCTPGDPCEAVPEAASTAAVICVLLSDRAGPFGDCFDVVDTAKFEEECLFDVCADPEEPELSCEYFKEYADECHRRGISVDGWRDYDVLQGLCAIDCGDTRTYADCGPATPATCTNPSPATKYNLPCVQGCQCNEGLVLSGNECVPLTECGCVSDGNNYQEGESFVNDDCSSRCTCLSASLVCEDISCTNAEVCEVNEETRGCYCKPDSFISEDGVCREMFTCRACGDPHYLTFDGKRYDYMGNCQYILARSRPDAPNEFVVIGDNIRPRPDSRVTITRFVYIFVHDLEVKFSWNTQDVLVKDVKVNLPFSLNDKVNIFRSGTSTILVTDFGLRVNWDGRACVHVSIPDTFVYNVEGLCGYLSRNITDDFTNPDGDIEPDNDKFGDDWGVGECEPCDAETCADHPCADNPEAATVATETCSPIAAVKSIVACEGLTLDISCEAGTFIQVKSAMYGRLQTDICPGLITHTGCHAPKSHTLPIVLDSCSGKQSCTIESNNEVFLDVAAFGDPCPRTRKYLEVEYYCVKDINGPFAACLNSGDVDTADFASECLFDLCADPDDRDLACGYIAQVADECRVRGYDVTGWRTTVLQGLCAIDCGDTKTYSDCGPATPATCANPSSATDLPCVQGCQCNEGLVLSGDECVPLEQCGCVSDGNYYKEGESFVNDDCSTRCACTSGSLVCEDISCTSGEACEVHDGKRDCYCKPGSFIPEEGVCREMFTCRACGDPHYLTFDGKRYDYMGNCQYILARSRPDAPNEFVVIGDNVRPRPNSRVTITRFVYISVYGLEVKFSWNTQDVFVNDLKVNLPFSLNEKVNIFRSGTSTILVTDFGLRVHWDGRACVHVSIPDTFVYSVEGLCGYLSRDISDDFTNPDGEIESDKDKFGDDWGVGECEPCTSETCSEHPCEDNPEAAAVAAETCSPLHSGDSISNYACENYALHISCDSGTHIQVKTAMYGRQQSDLCYGANIHNRCSAENALTIVKERCSGKQSCTIDNNNAVFGEPCYATKKYLQVEYYCINDTFKPLGACLASGNVNSADFASQCLFDLCADPDDRDLACSYIAQFVDECRARGYDVTGWRKAVLQGLCAIDCGDTKTYSDCGPATPATCTNPSPATDNNLPCVQGCQCNEGLVLSGDECVPPAECGCVSDGKYYKNGESFVNDDCRLRCTCTSGSLVCEDMNCDNNAVCKIQDNVRVCACNVGFEGDGLSCSEKNCVIDENEISSGESFVNDDCSSRCTCTSGSLTCEDMSCDANAICKIQDNVRVCACNVGFEGDGLFCTEKNCFVGENEISIGDNDLNNDCTQLCTCESGGVLTCVDSQGCGDGEICESRGGTRGCYCKQGNFISDGVCQETFTCQACGDPHYRTFDGKRYDYMGKCYYVLAQARPDAPNDFLVIGDNVQPPHNPRVTITRFVFIFVYGLGVQFSWNTRDVIVNDVKVNLPFRLNDQVEIFRSGRNTVLITDFGLRVYWDGRSCVQISIPSTFMHNVEGLCGYLSGDPSDDFRNPQGEIENDRNRFGDGWGFGDTCEPCTPETCQTDNPCEADAEAAAIAAEVCFPLADKSGAFAAGLDVSDPADLLTDCLYDLCVEPDEKDQSCEYFERFADEIRTKGVIVDGWRERIHQGLCAIDCGDTMTYSDCGPATPATCINPSPTTEYNLPCVQGCQCNEGLVLSGDECVPLTECGCVGDGKYYKEGDSFVNDDCSSRCTCTSAALICEDISCDANALCKIQDNARVCACNVGFEGDGLSCTVKNGPCDQATSPCQNSGVCVSADNAEGFVCRCPEGWTGQICEDEQLTCRASGDPHYLNFDNKKFDFQGNCEYILTKNCNNEIPEFSVLVDNVKSTRNNRVSLTRSVTLNKYGDVIYLGQNKLVKINGETVALPVHRSMYDIVLINEIVVIETDFHLIVEYNGRSTVKVKVPGSFGGNICGLCGNGNGQGDDDMATPEGNQESNINILGHTWAVNQDTCALCDDCSTTDACDGAAPAIFDSAQQQCSIITATSGYAPIKSDPANLFDLEEFLNGVDWYGNNDVFQRRRKRSTTNTDGPKPVHLGCFVDVLFERALPNHRITADDMTLEKCWQHCSSFGDQRYAGLQRGEICYCGSVNDDYSQYGQVEENVCEYTCTGNGEQKCGGLISNSVYDLGGGPFDKCHSVIDPQDYFKDCRYDWCANEGPDTLCETIADYAEACQLRGIEIMDWRAHMTGQQCAIACPSHSSYQLCASPCQPNCANPHAADAPCAAFCIEGCVCDDGYLLAGDACVPAANCEL